MKKSALVVLVLACASTAYADPTQKLCRGAREAAAAYSDFSALAPATPQKTLCFHVGRLTGLIEESMSFKNPEKVDKKLLALAAEMVDRAGSLKGYCGGEPVDGSLERGVRDGDETELRRQLTRLAGSDGVLARMIVQACH